MDWIILELVIEVLILGLILYFMIFSRRGRWRKDAEILNVRISEADALVKKAGQELSDHFTELKDLLTRLQRKEEALIKYMEMADKAMQDFRSSTRGPSREDQRGTDYEEALKLIEKGVSQKDISRITGIGAGEIDLIQKLKRKG